MTDTSLRPDGQSTPTTVAAEVQRHLAETAALLRREPKPISPELLRVALRGMSELCRLAFERGHESPAEPPFLFRNDPVVAEALGMWEQRLRAAMAEQIVAAGHHARSW